MARSRSSAGRYLVGELAAPSLGAATAYAASLAMREGRTVCVRVIGQQRAVARAEYDPNDRSVTIITIK